MSYKDFKALLMDLNSRRAKLAQEVAGIGSEIESLKDQYAITVADGGNGEPLLNKIESLTKRQAMLTTQIKILANQDHRGAVARSAREGNSELGRLAAKVNEEALAEISKLEKKAQEQVTALNEAVSKYNSVIETLEDIEHKSIMFENQIKEAQPYLPGYPSSGKARPPKGVRMRRFLLPAPKILRGRYIGADQV